MIKKLGFAALAVLAVALLVQTTITQAGSKGRPVAPSNPFVTLLEGIFEPVADVPDLGLSRNINNEAVLKIGIFNIDSGIPGPTEKVAGTFYVQFPMGDLSSHEHEPGGTVICALCTTQKSRAGMRESQRDSVAKPKGWRTAPTVGTPPHGGFNPIGVVARSCCLVPQPRWG